MNKFLTKVAKIFLGLSMAAGVGVAVSSNRVQLKPAEATSSTISGGGSKNYSVTVAYNGSNYSGIRYGTSSGTGNASFTIASGTTSFSFYGAAWASKTHTVQVSLSVGSISGSNTKALTANSAISGNSTSGATYTFTGTDDDYLCSFNCTNVTAQSTVTISRSSGDNRAVVWNANYTAAATTYTVSYNANGGSGAPSSQTGLANLNSVTLASTSEMTKFGYTSTGWSRDTNGATKHYNSGATGVNLSTYADANKTVTLYAYWEAKNYTGLTYTGEPSTKTYTTDDTFDPSGITAIYAKFDDVADTSTNVKSSISWNPLVKGTSATGTYTIGSVTQTVTITGLTITQVSSWTDTLTSSDDGATGTTYATKTGIAKSSLARYTMVTNQPTSGQFAFRTSGSDSGVVSTTSGGVIGSVSVAGCQSGRTIQIYGSNVAYESPSELFGSSPKGTLLGTITSESTILEITDEYEYVGVRSASSAVYMTSLTFVWNLPSTDPVVELDPSSSTSVELMRGNSDTSIKIHVKNIENPSWVFTYDEGESTGLSSSANISVSAGSLDANDISTLTVTTKAEGTTGTTILHISVSGTDCANTVPITVVPKPNLLKVVNNRSANPLVDITSIEVQNGSSTGYSFNKNNIYVEDTDGNTIEIGTISDYVTLSRISGDDCVSISGGKITGTSVGVAVVKFELKSLSSVYDTVTVNVVNDYNKTVTSITYKSDVSVSQGETLEVSDIISGSVTETRFDGTGTINDNEYLFAYSNNRSSAVGVGQFVYEITDTTLNPGDAEEREIHVFVTFDLSYHSSTKVDVVAADRPVTGLIVDGDEVSNGDDIAISIQRNHTYDLNAHVSVNPANASESHIVTYAIEDGGDRITLTNGVITAGNLKGETVACVSASPEVLSDFVIYFWISITRETVTITYDAPATWTKVTDDSTLEAGDVLLIGESTSSAVNGDISSQIMGSVESTFDGSTVIPGEDAIELTLGGTVDEWTLSDSSGHLLGATAVKKLAWDNGTTTWSIEIANGNATIQNGTSSYGRFLYNANDPRFTTYTSAVSSSMLLPQLYRKTGGQSTVEASSALLDLLDANMSYTNGGYSLNVCDASGASFDTSGWSTLGGSFTTAIKENNKLADAVANETGNQVEQFLAAYDYAIQKHGKAYDFLGRVDSGKITLSPRISLISFGNNTTNIVAIIVIISMVSVTAIGGYFFLRKRREQY